MGQHDWNLIIGISVIVIVAIAVVGFVLFGLLHIADPIYTYEGELVDIETSAGGLGASSKTTLYFKGGEVFVFDLIDEILVLHENYRLRYYKGGITSMKLVSIEMIGVE